MKKIIGLLFGAVLLTIIQMLLGINVKSELISNDYIAEFVNTICILIFLGVPVFLFKSLKKYNNNF